MTHYASEILRHEVQAWPEGLSGGSTCVGSELDGDENAYSESVEGGEGGE